VDVDWSVNMKRSSSEVQTMQIPAVLLELSVEESPSSVFTLPAVNKIGVELTKETLETMLEGLGKIRDQLSSMG
jgi:COMM domain containing 9